MQWFAYAATLLGLTVPLVIGFAVMGIIVIWLAIVGGEVYTDSDHDKRLKSKTLKKRTPARPLEI